MISDLFLRLIINVVVNSSSGVQKIEVNDEIYSKAYETVFDIWTRTINEMY
jgi:hypothetical protein